MTAAGAARRCYKETGVDGAGAAVLFFFLIKNWCCSFTFKEEGRSAEQLWVVLDGWWRWRGWWRCFGFGERSGLRFRHVYEVAPCTYRRLDSAASEVVCNLMDWKFQHSLWALNPMDLCDSPKHSRKVIWSPVGKTFKSCTRCYLLFCSGKKRR